MVKEDPITPPLLTFSIDPESGFCSNTKIFHSLRHPFSLPPQTTPLSVTSFIFSSLHRYPTTSSAVALLDSTTPHRILHSQLQHLVNSLAFSLHHEFRLSRGKTAFLLSLNSPHIPILYLSLFSLGVIVSPSNPANSAREISGQIHLCKPVIAFTTSDTAHKLPYFLPTILLDSPEFNSMMFRNQNSFHLPENQISQSDTAAILYSSGTTGNFKGVELTHRNFISFLAGARAAATVRKTPVVTLCAVPYFHVYGFMLCFREVALGGTVVAIKRFDLELMARKVEEFKVTHLALAPPSLVAMVNNADVASKYDLSSLEMVLCGGALLANAVTERFKIEFPNVAVAQAYGLTEATGGITRTMGPNESRVKGTVGRLNSFCQAKIVDPNGLGLPPFKEGELWVRGPTIMKGYAADKEATASILDADGWLKTGDICYFDNQGFLFYVERMKDLIKYKAYQVAPAELEHLLQTHPEITDAAVIPYPHEEAGQIPVAFVVRKSGSLLNEKQIIDFVAKQVAPYKKIRKVFFLDSIPKNAPGKVLKKELIKLSASGTASKL
ncbi:hypothetical protein ACH5RR_035496 [Cinchona calisaya]|uniref:4-coumarate--CoA ligase n=1 Tax=Cinchona calisaya TaxID=153742 RepID=A0ABD2Y593_9GENT